MSPIDTPVDCSEILPVLRFYLPILSDLKISFQMNFSVLEIQFTDGRTSFSWREKSKIENLKRHQIPEYVIMLIRKAESAIAFYSKERDRIKSL